MSGYPLWFFFYAAAMLSCMGIPLVAPQLPEFIFIPPAFGVAMVLSMFIRGMHR